jgi:PAS domain S-box-containing protein
MGADPFTVVTAFDVVLILLSLLPALLVSQAALSVTGRVLQTEGVARAAWLVLGSLCLGAGIWIMGLTASLAVGPALPARYAMTPGLLSTGLGVLGVLTALLFVRLRQAEWVRAVGGGILAGCAFAASNYFNVTALGIRASLEPDWRVPALVAGGAAIAWTAVLWMAIRFPADQGRVRGLWRVGSGLAVAAMQAGTTSARSAGAWASPEPSAPFAGGTPVLLTPEGVVAIAAGVLAGLAIMMVAAWGDSRVRLRRAETEALRRSEDRFRSLVQASAQIVWTTTPEGEMVEEQASWGEFTGQDMKAYQGLGWFNAVHPEDRERTARLWEETLANRRSVELEHRVRRYDGRYRDCVARVVPVLEPDGRVREWVGTHTDITDRARAQEERDLLAEAGRVLSSSLDHRETLGSVARLIVPRLADWCAIDVRAEDGSLQRLVAAHQDPYRSALLREIDPEAEGHREHGVKRVQETGESELIRTVTDEGLDRIAPEPEHAARLRQLGAKSMLWVPLTARGQVLGVLTLALSAEGEQYDLRDLAVAEELARRAAVAIDNAGLYSASQSAIRGRDEVLGVVSHDLRNPIGTIATASDLLLELDLPPAEQRRHLEIIRRSARSANRLIRDLLDVTQTDSGQLSVEPQPAGPERIVAEVCEAMIPLATEKGQRLAWELQQDLPLVHADPGRIQQVLSNLIANAIKFVPTGGAVLVDARAVEEGVRFSVIDTGPGIAPEDLPRLFDRHWRARKTAHLGAGLGLAISKGIIEAHGGRIWAESQPGVGAAFYFVLPAAPGVEPGPGAPGVPRRDHVAVEG